MSPVSSARPVTAPTERRIVAAALDRWLEPPLIALGLVWLALLVVELIGWLPSSLEPVVTGIWAIFVADYLLRLWLADRRWAYVRDSWLTLVALVVPALRVLRLARVVPFLRATRAVRGVRAVRVVTSVSRARRAVHRVLGQRHALGYVVATTAVVVFAGAAAMFSFEHDGATPFDGYAHALWWTAMIVVTMGSDIWPTTAEGRVVCLALAVYGFAVFGYITASLASWFVGHRKDRGSPDTA